jgi:purine-cytosine permease-like protein
MEPHRQPSVPTTTTTTNEKPSHIVLAPNASLPLHEDVGRPNEETLMGRVQLKWKSWETILAGYNLEARGIQRVEPDERNDMRTLGYGQIALFWFSINLAANNITLGMLGPAVFELGFLDSCLCAILGILVGCLAVGYMAGLGPKSGNRSMIISRYFMGWWPSKLVTILNIIVLLGYALIDCVVAGQVLSAVSGNTMSVVVGIIITAIITWGITTIGYQAFHYYERYAWIPQLVIFSILAGVAGPNFNTSAVSLVSGRTLAANRLSFFGLNLAAAITYSGGAADYFVYYPETASRWKIFAATMLGLSTSFSFAFVLGIGLACGMETNAVWKESYGISQGALIVVGYRPLGGFGNFCSVLVGLGLIQNTIGPTYSSGIDAQILGGWAASVPRVIWNTIGVVIYTVCALAGRGHRMYHFYTNFMRNMA